MDSPHINWVEKLSHFVVLYVCLRGLLWSEINPLREHAQMKEVLMSLNLVVGHL